MKHKKEITVTQFFAIVGAWILLIIINALIPV
jgi:hypothetical protein